MLLSLTRLAHAYTARLTTCTYGESNTHTHSHRHTCAPKASPRTARAWETTSWHTHIHTLKCILWTQYTNTEASRSAGNHRELKDWSTPPPPLPPSLPLSFSHTLSLSLCPPLSEHYSKALRRIELPSFISLFFILIVFVLPPIHRSFCGSRCSWQRKDIFISILERYESCYSLISPTTVCVRVCVWERECVCVWAWGGGGGREGQHLKTVSETLLTYNTYTCTHYSLPWFMITMSVNDVCRGMVLWDSYACCFVYRACNVQFYI